MRLYEIPFSTNVERVTLALALKGLTVEHVEVDPADRSPVVAVSGQDLVPVLVLDGGEVVADSTAILRRLDDDHPTPALWPADAARGAELDVFAHWFDRVWKVAPNAIADGGGTPDLWAELRAHVGVFERLLAGRPYLFGDALTVADLLAFPFLKYSARIDPSDGERFHQVLHEGQPLDGHPALAAWIERIDALPRA
ncbi:MAG TPA: glutathione S-transferase family protein [Solirubrobacteraceae bacterium]